MINSNSFLLWIVAGGRKKIRFIKVHIQAYKWFVMSCYAFIKKDRYGFEALSFNHCSHTNHEPCAASRFPSVTSVLIYLPTSRTWMAWSHIKENIRRARHMRKGGSARISWNLLHQRGISTSAGDDAALLYFQSSVRKKGKVSTASDKREDETFTRRHRHTAAVCQRGWKA